MKKETYKEDQRKYIQDPHAFSVEDVFAFFDSTALGIRTSHAEIQQKIFGKNILSKAKRKSLLMLFIDQLGSAMVILLFVAAAIAFFVGNTVDGLVILIVIVINAGVGGAQQYQAQRAIEALQKMETPMAKVYRDETLKQIASRDLVPGDVVLVEEGDRIPADARVVWAQNIRVDESSLTGESYPIEKKIDTIRSDSVLGDRMNMVWMGTFVSSGRAHILITTTGNETVLGDITKSVLMEKKEKSHFEKKIEILAWQMGFVAFFGAVLTFFIGFVWRGMEFSETLLVTIATLVSGIPEGLPAVLAIVLAISARRMAKKNALVRKLSSVETLGVVDTIVTDKTGTLTENKMMAKIFCVGDREIMVEGDGWNPTGRFLELEKPIVPTEEQDVRKLLHGIGWGNSARLVVQENRDEHFYSVIGDPTEGALAVLAEKAGLSKEVLERLGTEIEDIPFNSALAYRATLIETPEGIRERYYIGVPETIIRFSQYVYKGGKNNKFTEEEKKRQNERVEAWSEKSMRVLAIAYRVESQALSKNKSPDDAVFIGLVGLIDPPRREAKDAVIAATQAGIRVVMATGDHKKTAVAIGREVGILGNHEKGGVYKEGELKKMSNREFISVVGKTKIFARLSPSMKLRIVQVLQTQGHTVAVTGDGINDAPALRTADVGISMGKAGTDVARESSDIVLSDDNFSSIVRAVEEGRIVFDNVERSTAFLVTTNFAETILIVISLGMGLGLPILPTQILWLNLVTESFPNLALSMEPSHKRTLNRNPYSAQKNLLSWQSIPFMGVIVMSMAVLTVGAFMWFLPEGLEKARTATFIVLAWTQLFNMFNARSLQYSVFTIGIFTNKWVWGSFLFSVGLLGVVLYVPIFREMFSFERISWSECIALMLVSSFILWIGEGYKWVKGRV